MATAAATAAKLPFKFGPFPVTSQVFHVSPTRLSYALVNLKPLLPGHVLICPVRVTPRLAHLTHSETTDLFLTVRRVSRTLQRLFGPSAFNVAVQDGVAAGQSVPHVHVHVIPRTQGDYEDRGGGDAVYDDLESEAGELGTAFVEMWRARRAERGHREFRAGPDAQRVARGEAEMRDEAEWLAREMEVDGALGEGEDVDPRGPDGSRA